jgi:hypothetical protein
MAAGMNAGMNAQLQRIDVGTPQRCDPSVQEGDSTAMSLVTSPMHGPQTVPHDSAACTALRLHSPVCSMKPAS